MNKKIIPVIAAIAIVGGIVYFLISPKKALDPQTIFARDFLGKVYSQSLAPIQQMTVPGTSRLAPTWLPIISGYLQQNYGAVKDVQLISKQPVEKCEESTWQITAERGSYQMMTLTVVTTGKLAHIEFRSSPSKQWQIANVIASTGRLTDL